MAKSWSQIVEYAKKTQLGPKAKHLKGKPKLIIEKKRVRRARDLGGATILERDGKTIGIPKIHVSQHIKSKKVKKYVALHELREGLAMIQGKCDPHRTALRFAKRDREYLGIKARRHGDILGLAGYELEE